MRSAFLVAAALGVALSLPLLAGCGGGDHCARLAETLCAPGAPEPCVSFVDEELRAPEGATLTPEARQAACKLVRADDKALAIYRDRYRGAGAAPAAIP